MSDPVWPPTLPNPVVGMSGGPQANAVSFKPEVGPTIDRRRSSMVTRKYQAELPPLDASGYDTFVGFFTDTLKGGLLPFLWNDPFSRSTQRFKFAQGDLGFSEEAVLGGQFVIRFELTRLG